MWHVKMGVNGDGGEAVGGVQGGRARPGVVGAVGEARAAGEVDGGARRAQRDRDRLVVLKKAQKKLITQRQAAGELQVSKRQVRRLLGKLKDQGDRGLIHGCWNSRNAYQRHRNPRPRRHPNL